MAAVLSHLLLRSSKGSCQPLVVDLGRGGEGRGGEGRGGEGRGGEEGRGEGTVRRFTQHMGMRLHVHVVTQKF